jgi:hypothetical protein
MTDETKPRDDKVISAKCLTRSSQYDMTVKQLFEILPEDIEYQDLFHPGFWRHHVGLGPNTLVRLRHALGDFDVIVNVVHKVANGLLVEFFSGRPPRGIDPYKVETDARNEALRLVVAPIAPDGKPVCRTQFLPKTDFRVLGLGGAEVQRNIKTQKEAEVVLANYLVALNMRNPTDDELIAHAKTRTAAAEAASKESAPA